jgi:hypothetical protein
MEPAGGDPKRLELQAELDREITRARARAMTEYWFGQILMVITLATSALPAVLGIFDLLPPRQLGALAAAPAGMAFVAAIFKFPAKANWYWRYETGVTVIRDKLVYGTGSGSDPESIAKSRTKLRSDMRAEWEREFTISWVAFGRPQQNR